MPNLVLWKDNGRIGSLPLTDLNRDAMKTLFCMSIEQTDASGTEHWNVLGPWNNCSQGVQAARQFIEKYGRDEFLKIKGI